MKAFLLRLLLIFFPLIMGLLFIVFGFKNHLLGKASESWPTVQGVLVSESTTGKKKRTHIFYEYTVDGVKYKNSRVNFQDDKASKKEIQSKYNIGDTFTVYYDPQSHEQAVLQPGASMFSLFMKIGGGLFCFILAAIFLNIRRR